jgi:glycosyltransferase involved in cell wall biosynthesis
MKLLVNLNSLNHPLTGIGEYTLNIVKEILTDDQVQDIRGMRRSRYINRQQITALVNLLESGNENQGKFSQHLSRSGKLQLVSRVARKLLRIYNEFSLRLYRRMLKHYVYWEPNYICLNHQGVCVPTIHDLSHILCPQFHPKERVRHLQTHLPNTLTRAEHVIVVSEYTKQSVIQNFGFDENKITVVPPSVHQDYYPRLEAECLQLKHRLKLPQKFLLFVGTLEPRKNLKGLLLAYASLPCEMQNEYPLVLAGKRGWLLEEIDELLQPMLKSGAVIWLGYIHRADLPALYSSATALAYVSHYEGFGMPIAEAMAAGTAVIASDSTAMTEASGGAVCSVSPDSVESITQGIGKVLADSEYRRKCEIKGLEVSKHRSWKTSKNLLINALLNVHNNVQD